MDGLRMLYFLGLLSAVAAVTYKGTDYCGTGCGAKHFACQLKDEFGPRCYPPQSAVNITPHIDLILELHNEKRNEIADGDRDYDPASQMGEVSWDEELSFLAGIKAKQCFLVEDDCRSTKRFPTLGRSENYMKWWNGKLYSDEEVIKARVLEWMDQSYYANKSIVAKYPAEDPESTHVAFFGRAIIESNNRVGCAAIRYNSVRDSKIFLVSCYYPRDVEVGLTLYKTGPSASDCLKGKSSKYLNLCGVSEVYDYKPGASARRRSVNPRPVRVYPRQPKRARHYPRVPGEMFSL